MHAGVAHAADRPSHAARALAWLGARGWAWLAAALVLAVVAGAHAQSVLPVPPLSGRVVDQTGTLSAAQSAALDAKLAGFEQQAGPQIVLLLVPSTAPEDIAAYAQRVADSWKLGRREIGDGVLLVVAKDDRRVRIEVAKALEGAVPDLAARQIIERTMRPAFRANDYAGGLNAAVDALMGRIRGEGLPAPSATAHGGDRSGLPLDQLAIFFFVAVPVLGAFLSRIFGRRLGGLLTAGSAGALGWWLSASVLLGLGAGLVALLLVGVFGVGTGGRGLGRGGPVIGGWPGGFGGGGFGGGSGSGSGGGGGGGGFSSGGGGDFGGGGASGDW